MRYAIIFSIYMSTLALVPLALAQDADSPDTASEATDEAEDPKAQTRRSSVQGPEVITVTATKRETNLFKTPVAVSAQTNETLERQQVVDLKSVTALVPNLQIGTHGDSAAVDVSLRGIVSTNRTELGDPAVAFHVDGIYSPRPQGATTLLYDLERLEVLRGPQGTLFGRNANAGVINVATAKPQFDLSSASLDLTAGNYNLFRAKGHVNASPHSTFAVRAAAFVERREGFTDFQDGSIVGPGVAKYDNSDKTSFRLSARWKPSEQFEVLVTGEQFMDQGAGTVPLRITPKPGTERRSALIDSPGVLDLMNTSLRGRIDYQPIDFLRLTYLGGYGRMTRKNVNDNDVGFNEAERFQQEHRTASSRFLSQSHEIQIATVDTPWVDVLVGGFFYEENNRIRFDIDINDDLDGDLIPNQYWGMTFIQPKRILNSYAVFSQVTGKFTDWFRATGGIRYSSDTKSDEGGRNIVCNNGGAVFGEGVSTDEITYGGVNLRDLPIGGIPASPDFNGGAPHPAGTCGTFGDGARNDVEETWDEVTWMGRLEAEPLENWLVYATVNTGFKSGVIQDDGVTADPEYVTNYELGNRIGLLENRLNISLTGFYSDYRDILRSTAVIEDNGSQALRTINAAGARIFGVEAEVTWVATESDRLQLAGGYLNAKYDDFPTIDTAVWTGGNPNAPVTNLDGNFLPFAPEFSLTAVYEHTFAFDFGYIIPRIQTQIQTDMFLGDFNRDLEKQEAYTRTNLSIRYETDSGWLAEVFALNIEDLVEDNDIINNVAFLGNNPRAGDGDDATIPGTLGTAYGYLDAPGTYGIRIGYRWSE